VASDRETLKVAERSEFGSRTSRRLRRSGLVPGVVYGGGREARPFQVPERQARNVLLHGGALLDVQFDGGSATPVVVKEQQRDPVRGSLLHLDLLEVRLDEEIQAEVAIELLGTEDAPGVTEGGVLEHVTHQITIEALPTAIPESIPADVSGMSIGDTLQLSALTPPEGVEFALGEAGRVLLIGLGNPGSRYQATRHNLGFEIAAELSRRWELPRARERFRGLIAEGRAGAGGARVSILIPQTYMNESGTSAGPARG